MVVRLASLLVLALISMASFSAAQGIDQTRQMWDEVRASARAACLDQYAELDDFYTSLAAETTADRYGLWIDWDNIGQLVYGQWLQQENAATTSLPEGGNAVLAWAVTSNDYNVLSLMVGSRAITIMEAPEDKNIDVQAEELHILIEQVQLTHSLAECLRPTEAELLRLPSSARDYVKEVLARIDCIGEFESVKDVLAAHDVRANARQFATAYFDILQALPEAKECRVNG
jgi:hypothetical protein